MSTYNLLLPPSKSFKQKLGFKESSLIIELFLLSPTIGWFREHSHPAASHGVTPMARRSTGGTWLTRTSQPIPSSTATSRATNCERGPGAHDDFWTGATQALYVSQAHILLPSADDYCKAQSPLAPEQHGPVIPVG